MLLEILAVLLLNVHVYHYSDGACIAQPEPARNYTIEFIMSPSSSENATQPRSTVDVLPATSSGNATNPKPTADFSSSAAENSTQPWSVADQLLLQKSADSIRMYGNVTACPHDVTDGHHVPLNRRATCPWYYEVDHVATRYPSSILHARSSCECCVGSVGLRCEPIKRTINVLVESDRINGTDHFVESELEVTLGFTCVGPRTKTEAILCGGK